MHACIRACGIEMRTHAHVNICASKVSGPMEYTPTSDNDRRTSDAQVYLRDKRSGPTSPLATWYRRPDTMLRDHISTPAAQLRPPGGAVPTGFGLPSAVDSNVQDMIPWAANSGGSWRHCLSFRLEATNSFTCSSSGRMMVVGVLRKAWRLRSIRHPGDGVRARRPALPSQQEKVHWAQCFPVHKWIPDRPALQPQDTPDRRRQSRCATLCAYVGPLVRTTSSDKAGERAPCRALLNADCVDEDGSVDGPGAADGEMAEQTIVCCSYMHPVGAFGGSAACQVEEGPGARSLLFLAGRSSRRGWRG